MIEQPMFFAGNPIYRASNQRRDPDRVEQALNAESSCFLPVSKLEFPATTGREGKLLWGDRSWLKASTKPEEPLFLGNFSSFFDIPTDSLPIIRKASSFKFTSATFAPSI